MTERMVASLKGLVMDATRKANSGHPGGPFSSADFAVILFSEFLKFAPKYPKWHARDRFVLSAGHESMLLYSLLHFMDLLPIEELIRFRQMGSLTPGHPESHLTPGVEATTGPLGQGVAMAVGMAVAAAQQSSVWPENMLNPMVYCLCGDGDLQEDVAIGAATLAGHLGMDNLVLYYDKNDIQISGNTSRADSTHWPTLFNSLQWNVIEIDGHNHEAIRQALTQVQERNGKPTIIIGKTIMAKGAATLEGSHKTHGEPLKPEEIAATKAKLGLDPDAYFYVEPAVKTAFCAHLNLWNNEAEKWENTLTTRLAIDTAFNAYHKAAFSPEEHTLAPQKFDTSTAIATRVAFGQTLLRMAETMPGIIGGSADLEPSNNTGPFAAAVGEFTKNNREGRNLAFGVREFAMAAMQNGMALFGGVQPFGATFLTFSDYSRNAIRMSALQQLQVLHVFTHDSIFLGEDGPTHQSVEHVMSLRLIPDLWVMRPADAFETAACMHLWAATPHQAAVLCLTRQNVPYLHQLQPSQALIAQGAYTLWKSSETAPIQAVWLATGSEVHVALAAAKSLHAETGMHMQVVSMPCWELFLQQTEAYKNETLIPDAPYHIAIEAGVTSGWQQFTGRKGLIIGVDAFGFSAPAADLALHFGLTIPQVTERAKQYLGY